MEAKSAPVTALVLSGGGARGAYEAGVIRYLRDELPPALGPMCAWRSYAAALLEP